jgi:hypothetical protein
MVNFVTGGGAVQTSTGFGFVVDKQSVRHEQSLEHQTDHMRTGAYAPRQKLTAESQPQWQARLVRHPQETRDMISALETANARFAQAAEPPAPRPLSHKLGRAANWVLSVPDNGNVKVNREEAVRLAARGPAQQPAAPSPGYASIDQHKAALTATQQAHYTARLKDEAGELRAALLAQQTEADTVLRSPASRQVQASVREETRRNGDDGQAALAAAEANLQLARQPGKSPDLLATAQLRHDVAAAVHAQNVLPGLLEHVNTTLVKLEASAKDCTEKAVNARAALVAGQRKEIEDTIAALPGFEIRPGQQEAADALRARLRLAAKELLGQPFKDDAQAMPAPVLVDLLVGAMAATAKGDLGQLRLAADGPALPLIGLLHTEDAARVLSTVHSLPGGLLAAEQMTGVKIADKERRTATRVGALAAQSLAQTPAGERATQLRAAVNAAGKIAATGGRGTCDAAELAAYNAVRNGFLLQPDAGGRDQNLDGAEQRLDKFLGPWIDRAAEPARRAGPLLNKTPFDATSLRLANQTSILGYDAAERPMARLDKTLRRVHTQLDACVQHLPQHSLSADDAVQLAATLVAGQKAAAHPELRPGQVTLDADDVARAVALFHGPLRQLVGDAPPGEVGDALDRLNDTDTESPADPLRIAPLAQRIAGAITATDAAALQARESLLKDSGIVRDMTATGQVDQIGSAEDLFRFLEPMVQQLELRGKIKITSGGNLGGSSKLFTWPVSIAKKMGAEVVIPVRGEIKGNYARGAVFEIGFSTTGFEIFIGSETRKGRGVGAGVGVRAGWERIASSGGGVDKTLSEDTADTEGLWLRLPRNSNDEATRDEALAMLKTLFGMDGPAAQPQPAGVAQPADGGMPPRVGALLARHPNLSVSTVDRYREHSQRNELAVGAAALNVKAGSGDAAGRLALVNGGVKSERRNKRFELRDDTGFMQISRSNALSGGIAFVQAGLVSVGAGFDTGGAANANANFGNGFTYSRQLTEKGIDTKLRFITRDGETNPVDTRVDYENLNFANHRSRIDADRRAWLETGVRELFKPKAGQTLPPLNEQMRVAEHWMETMLGQAEEQSRGNARHVYSLSYSMMKSSAAAIDGLRAKAELARRGGDEQAARRIDLEVDELLQHPASWQPWKITTSERTSEKEQTGVNLGMIYGASTTAEGQRGTNSYPK